MTDVGAAVTRGRGGGASGRHSAPSGRGIFHALLSYSAPTSSQSQCSLRARGTASKAVVARTGPERGARSRPVQDHDADRDQDLPRRAAGNEDQQLSCRRAAAPTRDAVKPRSPEACPKGGRVFLSLSGRSPYQFWGEIFNSLTSTVCVCVCLRVCAPAPSPMLGSAALMTLLCVPRPLAAPRVAPWRR